ncbi:MAG: MtrB/PioB family decaheme-associated outer membrane protein [Psychromonas sp.]|jgi:MtrB/PioB family decaheme-associated outer membrane protein|uniref:MtrB/PioB family decaheme-associated outer membrane protein n=1 Tax=Psychromonas sp. TaxID=1884585 RepID=UPI0039E3B3D2
MTNNHNVVLLHFLAVALALTAISMPSWSLDMTFSPNSVVKEVNQENWHCKKCRLKASSEGKIEIGAAVVSNNGYAFRNLAASEDGAAAIFSGQNKWKNDSGSVAEIEATDLGLQNFVAAAGYHSAGRGGVDLGYQELPRYYSNQALTPYIAGETQLADNWLPGNTTDDMVNLTQSLHSEDIKLLRKQLVLSSDFSRNETLRPELKLRLEKKTGQRISSGYLGTAATNWVSPVDQQTIVIDAGITKISGNALFGVAYDGSLYHNMAATDSWQNPFTVSTEGTEYGQLAVAPDNQAHQLSVNSRYQWLSSQISGRFAYGIQSQNDSFNAYTINNSLMTEELPEQSANAKVQTINADINASHRINRQWRLTAQLKVQDRNNQTQSNLFTPVIADSFNATSVSNQAYSYRRDGVSVTAHYKGWREFPVKLGYDYKIFERSLGERNKTEDQQIWFAVKSKHWPSFVTDAKVIAGRRGGSDFTALVDNQSDLLRRYNLADRELIEVRLGANWQMSDSVSSLLKTRMADENYYNTEVGLTDRNRFSVDWDLNWQISELSSLYTGFGYQHLRYKQAGADSSGTPSWQGNLDDRTYSLMLGGDAKAFLLQPLDVGLDYVLSYSTNQQTVDLSVNNGSGYPENYYRNHMLNGWASYQLSGAAKIKFNMIYEHVQDRDYYWSSSQPDSLPYVLTVGDLSQNYSSWYAGLSYQYRF